MKKKTVLFLVIAFGVFALYLAKPEQNTNQVEFSLTPKELLLATLQSEISDLNKRLPLDLDVNTTLISIAIENEKIVSTHQLKDNVLGKVDANVIKNLILPRIISNTCNAEDKKTFINSGINIVLEYLDANKNVLFDVEITEKTCSV
jgi:hypothetical protein